MKLIRRLRSVNYALNMRRGVLFENESEEIMSNLTTEVFYNCIELLKRIAKQNNLSELVITSKDVHKLVGGYPGVSHRMPMCCDAMYNAMNDADEILEKPPKNKGATLKIKYYL